MAIQHWQFNCPTCKRATLHIRNTYDVPHVLHLLATVFLCGFWLPVWIAHTVLNALLPDAAWRCQTCGTAHGLFGGSGAAPIAITAKPAGPSTRAKVTGDKCPRCGRAIVPDMELGAAVLTCWRCGETFERAGG